ncbi:tRNA (guanine-N7-)-methyltransferase [Fonticula alba]|uniref:tRNA (guanine-N(7)-)-methyltransferase n=1 Tax=Fonticula alba TaxID=691883 RepID=A0A058ZGW8_FONAL|nr:tRNA (guanine-N7-)-methyltransferase [Fonticula alba]KCV72732.1 tRNA (guanine-N7-)-methyltransferase [Fonticula alba]|eukprot:XP_009492433.1 tRNA (guanine-N7-)-methyltransferase [Fonticula alba]
MSASEAIVPAGGAEATASGTLAALPQKKNFRQRAHSNPYADHLLEYPTSHTEMNWNEFFPAYFKEDGTPVYPDSDVSSVRFLDVGCGYGGLTVSMSKLYPDRLTLGMEIRVKVSSYVHEKIQALRQHGAAAATPEQLAAGKPTLYQNASVMRANTMKHLTRFFGRGQLEKIFFLFPDPHFKRAKHKWRIISPALLDEYAYVLRPGGIVYTISDVLVLHRWMDSHLEAHPMFERVSEEEIENDPAIYLVKNSSEEAQRVDRNGGRKFLAIFRRIVDPDERNPLPPFTPAVAACTPVEALQIPVTAVEAIEADDEPEPEQE